MQYFTHDTLKQFSFKKWEVVGEVGVNIFFLEDICDIVFGLFETKIKQLTWFQLIILISSLK